MTQKNLTGAKICIVHPATISTDVRIYRTVKMLKQQGATITLAFIDDWNSNLGEIDELVSELRISPKANTQDASGSKTLLGKLRAMIAKPASKNVAPKDKSPANPIEGFAGELIKYDFDLVHFINYSSCIEARRFQLLSKVPTVYEAYECWQRVLTDKEWLKAERDCIKGARQIIVVSEPIKEAYADISCGIPVSIIMNISPTKAIVPNATSDPVKIYIQTIIRPHYGIEDAIKLFSLIKSNCTLTIQGPCFDQDYQNSLHEMTNSLKLGDRITFEEAVPFTQSDSAANEYDVGLLLLPNTIDGINNINAEWSLPNKLFTYASGGLAMIFNHFQSATMDFVKEYDCALFIDARDLKYSAKIIDGVISDSPRLNRMKKASHTLAQNFNIDKESEKLLEIYLKALSD